MIADLIDLLGLTDFTNNLISSIESINSDAITSAGTNSHAVGLSYPIVIPWEYLICTVILCVFIVCFFKLVRSVLCKIF